MTHDPAHHRALLQAEIEAQDAYDTAAATCYMNAVTEGGVNHSLALQERKLDVHVQNLWCLWQEARADRRVYEYAMRAAEANEVDDEA